MKSKKKVYSYSDGREIPMPEDSDEFFEKYKPAVPKPWYADGSMSNDDGKDISYKLDTPWDTVAFPIKYLLLKKTDKGWRGDGFYTGHDGKLEAETIAEEYKEEMGVEVKVLKAQPSDFIWTVCHVDDATYICQGFQFVNRAYYIYATVPYQEGDKDTYCYMEGEDEMYLTIDEAMLEVEGLVNAEVSSLKKSNQDGDIEMAQLLDNSIKVIKGHFNEVS